MFFLVFRLKLVTKFEETELTKADRTVGVTCLKKDLKVFKIETSAQSMMT